MTSLDQLVEQTLGEYHQYQQDKAQKSLQEKRAREQEAEAELVALLERHLTPEFRAQVEFTYHHKHDPYHGYQGVEASFRYLDKRWDLSYQQGKDYHHQDATSWRIECGGSQKGYGIEGKHLQVKLLVEMGKALEAQREQQAKEEEQQKRWAENDQKRKEQEEQEAWDKAERIATALSQHERLAKIVEEKRAKALQEMWHWPEGVSVTIYEITYCTGAYIGEDGSDFDYTIAWTMTAELGEDGWITLYPKRGYDWEGEKQPRQVKLDIGMHHVVWERHTYSSLEDLPQGMIREVTFAPGIIAKRNSDLDGKFCFVEDTKPDEYYSHWHTEILGKEPVGWVRDLVDQNTQDPLNW